MPFKIPLLGTVTDSSAPDEWTVKHFLLLHSRSPW